MMIASSALLFITLHFLVGIVGANFSLALTRLMMNTMPPMGRSHFFAFYSVITSLGLAFAPIFWGVMIDSLEKLNHATGPVHWNKYSVFYLALLLLTAVTWGLAYALHEKIGPVARPSVRELLFTANIKRISRLWQR